MGKRLIKKRVKNIILAVMLTAFIFVILILGFNTLKYLSPILNVLNRSSSKQIVRPVGTMTRIDELKLALAAKNIIFEELHESSGAALIIGKIKSGPKVYFSQNKDVGWQITSLQLILSKLTIDNIEPSYIDLRNDRPIVKF